MEVCMKIILLKGWYTDSDLPCWFILFPVEEMVEKLSLVYHELRTNIRSSDYHGVLLKPSAFWVISDMEKQYVFPGLEPFDKLILDEPVDLIARYRPFARKGFEWQGAYVENTGHIKLVTYEPDFSSYPTTVTIGELRQAGGLKLYAEAYP
jgi:hypothetical protein